MTEQAKVAYLQEKLKEIRGKERSGFIVFIFGIVLLMMGWLMYNIPQNIYMLTPTGEEVLLRTEYTLRFVGTLTMLLGTFSAVFGLASIVYYDMQKQKSLEEMKDMATEISNCPSCGKRILQKTPYCPFCGKPLET